MDLKERIERFISARKKNDEQGFTLMEMLIVVAIIAVLIAIAIPIFTSQLEKSRESTDAANMRSAYAVATARVLTDGGKTGVAAGPITLEQAQGEWQNTELASQKIGNATVGSAPTSGDVYVNVSKDGQVSIASSATSGYTVVDPVSGEAASANNGG